MSNFPLGYKLSWLPRLLKPSLAGKAGRWLPAQGLLIETPARQVRRLAFVGDISAVANREAPEVDDGLRTLLATADLVVGNCESPVVERPLRRFGTAAGTRHAMTPSFLVDTIDAAGIPPQRLVLSLANNHMLDQGEEGFDETRRALAGLGIATIGTVEGGLVRQLDLGGLTLDLAAFTQWRNASRREFEGRVVTADGFAEGGFAALREARADLRCVIAHWDREFRHFPQAATRGLAGRLAETGVKLIVGHHAHVLQPAQLAGEAFVAYGLGDFLGTALPRTGWPLRLGTILLVEISADPETRGEVAGFRFVPFLRERAGSHERLVPLDGVSGAEGRRAAQRFQALFPPGVQSRRLDARRGQLPAR
jgi:poly-gamma-glutamate synthesis protein (capsule biosynthesis protein)